ncbi:MAG: hypothetical protein U5L96_16005 [Owenweeksia sp.]|nr:hypothetical protein [Owenweeksia sp.]
MAQLICLWKVKLQEGLLPLVYRRTYVAKIGVASNEIAKEKLELTGITGLSRNKASSTSAALIREHSYNNDVSQLIAQTFKTVNGNTRNNYSSLISDMHPIKNAFVQVTGGQKLPLKKVNQVKYFDNPYYIDYNEVIHLSKLILRNKLSDFGESSTSSAFLFDVSMLFEYDIKKLPMRNGFRVGRRDQNQLRIPTGGIKKPKHKLEPDIVIQETGGTHVFDVKYKSYNFREGVKREDLFQLHTYLGC